MGRGLDGHGRCGGRSDHPGDVVDEIQLSGCQAGSGGVGAKVAADKTFAAVRSTAETTCGRVPLMLTALPKLIWTCTAVSWLAVRFREKGETVSTAAPLEIEATLPVSQPIVPARLVQ